MLPTLSEHTIAVADLSDQMTRREVEVLRLLSQGFLTKEIAALLNISAETVKKHLKNIYQKTDSHNKIEALNKTKWLTASPSATNTTC